MEKNIFKLPIHISDVDCVTECWIFNRLAIIKNSPYYEDWIASHYSLYADSDYNFFFGETSTVLPSYHDIILERKQIRLFGLSEENIIEKIKEEIISGRYVVMVIDISGHHNFFHEVLFYGYNDEESNFFVAGLKNRLFQPMEYSYSYIKDTLMHVKNHFIESIYNGMGTSLYYQYPVTSFKLISDYNPENCVFEAYHKLEDELSGVCHRKGKLDSLNDSGEPRIIYRGINCLLALNNMIKMELKHEEFPSGFRGLTQALKKIYEHQTMNLCSMEYILKKWSKAFNDQSVKRVFEYRRCCSIVEKWSALALKYEYTGELRLLETISSEIMDVYRREEECLDEFLHNNIDWSLFNENFI